MFRVITVVLRRVCSVSQTPRGSLQITTTMACQLYRLKLQDLECLEYQTRMQCAYNAFAARVTDSHLPPARHSSIAMDAASYITYTINVKCKPLRTANTEAQHSSLLSEWTCFRRLMR